MHNRRLEEGSKWKNLNLIGMVHSEQHIGGKISQETSYFISTPPNDAKRFPKPSATIGPSRTNCTGFSTLPSAKSGVRDRSATTNLTLLRRFALTFSGRQRNFGGPHQKSDANAPTGSLATS